MVSLSLCWFVVYSTRRFILCHSLCYYTPRHTKFVEGYIVFVFLSVRPSVRSSVPASVRMLTFCVKVLREVFFLLHIFLKAYT